MKRFLKSVWGQLCVAVLCIGFVCFALFCLYQYEEFMKPKFHDVTVKRNGNPDYMRGVRQGRFRQCAYRFAVAPLHLRAKRGS